MGRTVRALLQVGQQCPGDGDSQHRHARALPRHTQLCLQLGPFRSCRLEPQLPHVTLT